MLVPQEFLEKAIKINFIKFQYLNTRLFNI